MYKCLESHTIEGDSPVATISKSLRSIYMDRVFALESSDFIITLHGTANGMFMGFEWMLYPNKKYVI